MDCNLQDHAVFITGNMPVDEILRKVLGVFGSDAEIRKDADGQIVIYTSIFSKEIKCLEN